MKIQIITYLVCSMALRQVWALNCYSGFSSWSGAGVDVIMPNGTLITKGPELVSCGAEDGCCLAVSSLPGSTYKCAAQADCPPLSAQNDTKCSAVLDTGTCYCRDHSVSDCIPDEFKQPNTKNDTQPTQVNDETSLKCYSGVIPWEANATFPIPLVTCGPEHFCCVKTDSLPGSIFECSDNCPSDWAKRCGPDPELGLMDVAWCYCKDYTDKTCRPFEMDAETENADNENTKEEKEAEDVKI